MFTAAAEFVNSAEFSRNPADSACFPKPNALLYVLLDYFQNHFLFNIKRYYQWIKIKAYKHTKP